MLSWKTRSVIVVFKTEHLNWIRHTQPRAQTKLVIENAQKIYKYVLRRILQRAVLQISIFHFWTGLIKGSRYYSILIITLLISSWASDAMTMLLGICYVRYTNLLEILGIISKYSGSAKVLKMVSTEYRLELCINSVVCSPLYRLSPHHRSSHMTPMTTSQITLTWASWPAITLIQRWITAPRPPWYQTCRRYNPPPCP